MADTIEQRTPMRAASTDSAAIVVELQAHASEIHKHGVTSFALFGSRARGDERKESDLDVLIGCDPERPVTLYELVRIERPLEKLTGLDVCVATRDAFRPHRLQRVLKDAVSVL